MAENIDLVHGGYISVFTSDVGRGTGEVYVNVHDDNDTAEVVLTEADLYKILNAIGETEVFRNLTIEDEVISFSPWEDHSALSLKYCGKRYTELNAVEKSMIDRIYELENLNK